MSMWQAYCRKNRIVRRAARLICTAVTYTHHCVFMVRLYHLGIGTQVRCARLHFLHVRNKYIPSCVDV